MVIQSKKFKEAPELQKEITELEKKVVEKKQELEKKKEVRPEKEIIKEVIRKKVEESTQPKTTPRLQKVVIKKASQIKKRPKERQIELLTDLTFEKGIIHAIEVAKKLDDPYILDEFHDTLVDKLYNYLIEQKKLKQV